MKLPNYAILSAKKGALTKSLALKLEGRQNHLAPSTTVFGQDFDGFVVGPFHFAPSSKIQ
jgi:hypothetical protein